MSEYIDPVKISDVMSKTDVAEQNQDDNYIIACAIAAETDYLVTGDHDLLFR